MCSKDLHWVPTPMPMPITAHAHEFGVDIGAILLFMGGYGCDISVYRWAWVGMAAILSGMGGHGFHIIMNGHGFHIIIHA